eukprot:PhF_6_TR31242/c0_g1_i1/m.45787
MFRRYVAAGATVSVSAVGYWVASSLTTPQPLCASIPNDEYDFIVVGGGAAGCVTAHCLAEFTAERGNPAKVLLIDRGPSLSESDLRLEKWDTEWGTKSRSYESYIVNKDGSRVLHPVTPTEHCGLGGGTAHNTAIVNCLDETERVRQATALNLPLDFYNACQQAALSMEPIVPANKGNAWWDKILETVTASGEMRLPAPGGIFPGSGDPNTVGYFSVTGYPRKNNKVIRYTPALLVQEHNFKNLTVMNNTKALKLEFSRAKPEVTGVCVEEQDKCRTIKLKQGGEVIVALGALSAPAFLQWSGVGDPELLKRKDIPVIVPNQSIGNNNGYDHTEATVVYDINGLNPLEKFANGNDGAMGWDVGMYKSFADGSFVQSHVSIGGFPYTTAEDERVLVVTPNLTEPTTRFSVEILSKDPKDEFVVLQEPFTSTDKEILVKGVKETIRLFKPAQLNGMLASLTEPKSKQNVLFEELTLGSPFHWHHTVPHYSTYNPKAGRALTKTAKVRFTDKEDDSFCVSNLRVTGASCIEARRNLHVPIMAHAILVSTFASQEYFAKLGKESRLPSRVQRAHDLLKISQGKLTYPSPGGENPARWDLAENLFRSAKP